MITIGIDIVDIARFATFATYKRKTLLRVFSPEEIIYALSNPAKSAERFAVRFAAKEAFLKAFAQQIPKIPLSFHAIAPLVTVEKHPNKSPYLSIDWHTLAQLYPASTACQSSVSLSHTQTLATAIVQLL